MTKFAVFALCAQALLIQAAYGQCIQSIQNQGPIGYGGINQIASSCGNLISSPVISSPQTSCGYGPGPVISSGAGISSNNGGYGGIGNGQLAILGELPIGGNTLVEGNLPVIGVVEFNGALPAGGFVTIVGNTPNECGNYGGNYGVSSCGCY